MIYCTRNINQTKEDSNYEIRNKKTFKKKLLTGILSSALVVSVAIPTLAANNQTKNGTYLYAGCMYLTCTNSITAAGVSGSTNGAPSPYYNHVIIKATNKKGETKVLTEDRQKNKISSISKWKLGLTESKTYHSALNPDYTHVGAFTDQIVITKTR